MKRKGKRKKDNKESIISKEFIFLLVLFVLTFWFNKENDKIIYIGINLVKLLIYIIPIILTFLVIHFKKKSLEIGVIEKILVSFFIGYIVAMIFIIPINHYNINVFSLNHKVQIYNCELSGIARSRRTQGFYFNFMNEKHFIKGFKPIFSEIENNMDRYSVRVNVRKGLLNSYVIEDYKIIEKPDSSDL